MSLCVCPEFPKEIQEKLLKEFLELDLSDWNLLSLQDMYTAGNTLEDITKIIPFKGGPCSRTRNCCGMCTRKCHMRCVQDCLHRLYMWRRLVESTPESERRNLPLNIQCIVKQKFKTLYDLSWAVSDIISSCSNTKLKEYMKNENIYPCANPNKIDYAPQVEINPNTGKRVTDPVSGRLRVVEWPATGLCPYCLPGVTIDRRFRKSSD